MTGHWEKEVVCLAFNSNKDMSTDRYTETKSFSEAETIPFFITGTQIHFPHISVGGTLQPLLWGKTLQLPLWKGCRAL